MSANSITHVDLSQFENSSFYPGRPFLLRALWFLIGHPLLRSSVIPSSFVRQILLRCFGAKIGPGAVIKPGVRVKYPWHLTVGKHCWLGEDCWIDNVAQVTLGDNVCISQGAYICTGNHDWSDPTFKLVAEPIQIKDGAWIAATARVGPGVVVGRGAIVAFGAVVLGNVPPGEIHGGNPAVLLRRRQFKARGENSPARSLS